MKVLRVQQILFGNWRFLVEVRHKFLWFRWNTVYVTRDEIIPGLWAWFDRYGRAIRDEQMTDFLDNALLAFREKES